MDQSFFPSSTRPQFMVDFWLPQGTHIDRDRARDAEAENYLLEQDGVTHVTSLVGKGGLRFLLTYAPEKLNSAYVQFLVDVDDPGKIDGLVTKIEGDLAEAYPNALAYVSKFQLGPGSTGKIQARFSGPDPDVLRRARRQEARRSCTTIRTPRASAPIGASGSRSCSRSWPRSRRT